MTIDTYFKELEIQGATVHTFFLIPVKGFENPLASNLTLFFKPAFFVMFFWLNVFFTMHAQK